MARFTVLRSNDMLPESTEIGGKAKGLLDIAAQGVPIPPGFAISAQHSRDAWDRVASSTRKRSGDELAVDLRESMSATLVDRINEQVSELDVRYGLAVRSSALREDGAQHSYAGVYESILGIEPSAVLDAIARVWASSASNLARAYNTSVGGDVDDCGMGVIVQVLLRPRVAGVVFTLSPLDPCCSTLLVEAVWGFADHLLAGRMQPDSYEVARVSRREVSVAVVPQGTMRQPGACSGVAEVAVPRELVNSRKLTSEELSQVVEIALEIEKHAGVEQDVEFAIDEDGLKILQARPITSTTHKGSE